MEKCLHDEGDCHGSSQQGGDGSLLEAAARFPQMFTNETNTEELLADILAFQHIVSKKDMSDFCSKVSKLSVFSSC
jgi:hypothetical protein